MKIKQYGIITIVCITLLAAACNMGNQRTLNQSTPQTKKTGQIDYDIMCGDQWYLNYIPDYYGDNPPILYDQKMTVEDISNWYYDGRVEMVSVEGADDLIQYLQNTNISLSEKEQEMILNPVRENNRTSDGGHFGMAIYPDGTWKLIIPFYPSLRQIDKLNHSTEIVLSSWMFDENEAKLKELKHEIYDPHNSSYGIFYRNEFSFGNNGTDCNLEEYYLGGIEQLTDLKMTQNIKLNGEVRKAGHIRPFHLYLDGFMITGDLVFELVFDGMETPYRVTYRYYAQEYQNMDESGSHSMTDESESYLALDIPNGDNPEEKENKEKFASKAEVFSADGQQTEYTLYTYSDDTIYVMETTYDMNGEETSVVDCTYSYVINGEFGDKRRIVGESFEDNSYVNYEYDSDLYLIRKVQKSFSGEIITDVKYTPEKQTDGTVISKGDDGSVRYYDPSGNYIRYTINNLRLEMEYDSYGNILKKVLYEDDVLKWYVNFIY